LSLTNVNTLLPSSLILLARVGFRWGAASGTPSMQVPLR
jgi:hypothetical protein